MQFIDHPLRTGHLFIERSVIEETDKKVWIAIVNLLCHMCKKVISFSKIDIILGVELRFFIHDIDSRGWEYLILQSRLQNVLFTTKIELSGNKGLDIFSHFDSRSEVAAYFVFAIKKQ